MSESRLVLDIRNLSICFDQEFGTVEVVKGVSFSLNRGETVALVGESGAGKSIISRAVMGLLPRNARISSGSIQFHDEGFRDGYCNLAELEPDSSVFRGIRGDRISLIFQEPMTSLSPFHTIGNQIGEALRLHRDVSSGEEREIIVDMLDKCGFPNPEQAIGRYAFELSGGLRQRAMIAMALICHPAILVADEPTTALDVTVQAQILKLIKELQATLDIAVLLITHDLGVVANMADQVVVLYRGEVMESGEVNSVFRQPKHPYLIGLMKAVPDLDAEHAEKPQPDAKGLAQPNAPLLTVSNISKTFRSSGGGLWGMGPPSVVKAVNDVSFEIYPGETVGLVGESGCGKSTLSKLVIGALTPDSGQITYRDKDGTFDGAEEGVRRQRLPRAIQMMFQDPFGSLNPRMTLLDVVREPLIIQKMGTRDEQIERVHDVMRLVGLDTSFLSRYPHSMSGGQRQRVALARALVLSPELLILDEPTSALDVLIQAQILALLKDVQEELGTAHLLISHNLAVVDDMADRTMVMSQGRIVEEAPSGVLFRRPVHPYTRALIASVPVPDLDRKLNLGQLEAGRDACEDDWPSCFRPGGEELELVNLENGHRVLAVPGSRPEMLSP